MSLTSESSKKALKSTHHGSVQIRIVLVCCLVNEIKLACNQPRAIAKAPDVSKLLQEQQLLFIFPRAACSCEPPVTAFLFREQNRHQICVDPSSDGLAGIALPGNQNHTPSSISRSSNKFMKG
jgi:hypothetical protein